MTEKWFTNLQEANAARQIEWDAKGELTLAFRGNELAGEVGETLEKLLSMVDLAITTGRLANTLKKLERERLGKAGSRASVDQIAEELADVNICLSLIANDLGIELDLVTADKFNATSIKLGLNTRLEVPINETSD